VAGEPIWVARRIVAADDQIEWEDDLTTSETASGPISFNGHQVDEETREWLVTLDPSSPNREDALARLHGLLLRVAKAELSRRRGRPPITGPELDDLAHQATDDALVAITGKLDQFRGESRFTTWAYKFAILEVSSKLARHFWQNPHVPFGAEDWERLPDTFGIDPGDHAQRVELVRAFRKAVDEVLTPHQREVFVAIFVDGVPLEALALKINSNRNAIYKTMFDARRRLRTALEADGFLTWRAASRSSDGPKALRES
jgi:RNA polymerase sigma-70 factor, ECF subfamily